jgi:electron transport complex protein RnfE
VAFLKPFREGITKNMPPFLLVLGICPTLATTTSVKNAVGMAAAVIGVLTCSNIIISALRKLIPNQVRIPCYIVIVASFVTMVELIIKASSPTLSRNLGIFIPLIVVNCIILGRAEAFANRNTVLDSIGDGLGVGISYTFSLVMVSTVREILGNGTFFGTKVAEHFSPAAIMVQAPGAFLVLGLFLAFFRWMGMRREQRKLTELK